MMNTALKMAVISPAMLRLRANKAADSASSFLPAVSKFLACAVSDIISVTFTSYGATYLIS